MELKFHWIKFKFHWIHEIRLMRKGDVNQFNKYWKHVFHLHHLWLSCEEKGKKNNSFMWFVIMLHDKRKLWKDTNPKRHFSMFQYLVIKIITLIKLWRPCHDFCINVNFFQTYYFHFNYTIKNYIQQLILLNKVYSNCI
jgi:hypothetical protein